VLTNYGGPLCVAMLFIKFSRGGLFTLAANSAVDEVKHSIKEQFTFFREKKSINHLRPQSVALRFQLKAK